MERGFIVNIVAIAVVLAVAFLSQQPQFWVFGRNIAAEEQKQANGAVLWFKTHIYPKVSQEVEKRGEEAAQEIAKQKDIAAKNLWEKIKLFFAQKFSGIVGTKVE